MPIFKRSDKNLELPMYVQKRGESAKDCAEY